MKLGFGDAISILGLYLTLVGLLSTFFYVHLGQWLNSILGNESRWKQIKGRTPKDQYYDKKLECYFEAVQSSSIWTFYGWLAVTIFLVLVTIFQEILRINLPGTDSATVFFYINLPSYVFLFLYLLLSISMLVIGYKKAKNIRDEVQKSL